MPKNEQHLLIIGLSQYYIADITTQCFRMFCTVRYKLLKQVCLYQNGIIFKQSHILCNCHLIRNWFTLLYHNNVHNQPIMVMGILYSNIYFPNWSY